MRSKLPLEIGSDQAPGNPLRRQDVSLRKLWKVLLGSQQPAPPHSLAARGCQESPVPGVRKDFCDVQWSEATHAHPQQHQAIHLRGVLEVLHAVLQPVSAQADARKLPHPTQVCHVWSDVLHGDLTEQAPPLLPQCSGVQQPAQHLHQRLS